jgi:hypothetical protein
MDSTDSFAIVVSAPALKQATFDQANLAERLVNAKLTHELEVVSLKRARKAQVRLNLGMRVFFHQGGAPSKWARQFPLAGCLIAAGYYAEIHPLASGSPPPGIPLALWNTETSIFAPPQWEFTHFIRYQDVRLISDRILTKEAIGRWPRPGENFIIVGSQDEGFPELNRLWRRIMS